MQKVAKSAKGQGRGSRPGERRGGRKPGTPNRVTAIIRHELAELAQPYAPECIAVFAKMLKHKEPMVRFHGANALLDRGYGKAAQRHDVDVPTGLVINVNTITGQLPLARTITLDDAPALTNGHGSNGNGSGPSE